MLSCARDPAARGYAACMRSQWWILYSVAVLIFGVVLVVLTGGSAGIILIAGGLIGIVIRGRQFRR
jgi:hypothetical protein